MRRDLVVAWMRCFETPILTGIFIHGQFYQNQDLPHCFPFSWEASLASFFGNWSYRKASGIGLAVHNMCEFQFFLVLRVF